MITKDLKYISDRTEIITEEEEAIDDLK